jgi:hypothetical protein
MPLFRRKDNGQFGRPPAGGPPPPEKLEAEQTGPQQASPLLGSLAPVLVGGFGVGGAVANPSNFPGWDGLGASWDVPQFRLMLRHPVIRLARQIVVAPVLSNTWTVKKTDAGTQQAEDFVRDTLAPQRRRLCELMSLGIDFGRAFGEKVWRVEHGRYVPAVKPLAHELTSILADDRGNVVGLTQGGIDQELIAGVDANGNPVRGLGPYKAFLYTHDGTDPYFGPWGRSRLLNVADYAWRPWLDTMQDLARLRNKLSGVIGMGFAPEIVIKGQNGAADVSLWDKMKDAVKAVKNYGFALIPTFFLNNGQPPANAGDAAKMFHFEFYDAGNHSPAIAGYLASLNHYESLMFAGMLRSARTGLEGQHGTKAEAGVHTDTGMTDSELIDDDFAECVRRQVVDDLLVLNFGENARGTVEVKAPPIADTRTEFRRAIVKVLLANADVAVGVARVIDWRKALASEEMDLLEEIAVAIERVTGQPVKPTDDPPPPPGNNGRQQGGNGRRVAA